MNKFKDLFKRFKSHERDLFAKTADDLFEKYVQDVLPKLKQKVRDLRAEYEKKKLKKKTIENKLFEVDFLSQRIRSFVNDRNADVMLIERSLTYEKDDLRNDLSDLNMEKMKQKISQCEKEIADIEQRIEWVNYFLESLKNGS